MYTKLLSTSHRNWFAEVRAPKLNVLHEIIGDNCTSVRIVVTSLQPDAEEAVDAGAWLVYAAASTRAVSHATSD